MPKNQFQKMVFAFVTVIITVHAYIFYSLYVVNGQTLLLATGAKSVLDAIHIQGGIYMLGGYVPIWLVVVVEFCLAYLLEIIVGSPFSFQLTCKMFEYEKTHPSIFETAIICSTVLLMCPIMSFIAAILYYPFYNGFHVITLLANWIKLICFNFPFAFFTQIFFIQPFVRKIFQYIFVRHSSVYMNPKEN